MASDKLEAQYKELDTQIESLMKCQPLPEAEVKVLCDKAREILQVRLSILETLVWRYVNVSNLDKAFKHAKCSKHVQDFKGLRGFRRVSNSEPAVFVYTFYRDLE